jgi:hypothetical protein
MGGASRVGREARRLLYVLQYRRVEARRQRDERHSALNILGYTARWQVEDDPTAAALVALVQRYWTRFVMRLSNAPVPFACPTTITIETRHQKPADAILCPEQVGRTESCSTCALCWQSKRRIAFLQH